MEPFGVKVSLVEPGNFIIGAPSEVTAENRELNAMVQEAYGEKYLKVSQIRLLSYCRAFHVVDLIRNESPPRNGTWRTTARG